MFEFVLIVFTMIRGGTGLLVQAARLGAIYVAIATAIHAGIVLLARQLKALQIADSYQKPMRRLLAITLALVAAWLAWTTRRMWRNFLRHPLLA